jgi:hypothetical protein
MLNNIVGPLPQKYCMLFYVLSIVSFITFILSIFSILYAVFLSKTKMGTSMIMNIGLVSLSQLLMYVQTRIFYNMCINSIH